MMFLWTTNFLTARVVDDGSRDQSGVNTGLITRHHAYPRSGQPLDEN